MKEADENKPFGSCWRQSSRRPLALRASHRKRRRRTIRPGTSPSSCPTTPGVGRIPVARQFCGQLEKELGRSVNVENKAGGIGDDRYGVVVRAKPDGYTIGLGSNTILAFQPFVVSGLPFNKTDDYQPIVKLMDQHVNLVVRADAPWKTFDEFMADVRKNPGKIRASVSGKYGQPDLVVQQLTRPRVSRSQRSP